MIIRWQSGNEHGPRIIRWSNAAIYGDGVDPPAPSGTRLLLLLGVGT